jgi:hypothetical protein
LIEFCERKEEEEEEDDEKFEIHFSLLVLPSV